MVSNEGSRLVDSVLTFDWKGKEECDFFRDPFSEVTQLKKIEAAIIQCLDSEILTTPIYAQLKLIMVNHAGRFWFPDLFDFKKVDTFLKGVVRA